MTSSESTSELRVAVPGGIGQALSAGFRGFRNFLRLALGTTAGRIGLPIVAIHVFVAIFGPFLAPYNPTEFHLFPNFPKDHQLTGPWSSMDYLEVTNAVPRVDFLLSISLETQESLDSLTIPEHLKTELRDNEVDVSNKATVSLLQEGSGWLISDQDRAASYSLRKEGEQNSVKVKNFEARVNMALTLQPLSEEDARILMGETGVEGYTGSSRQAGETETFGKIELFEAPEGATKTLSLSLDTLKELDYGVIPELLKTELKSQRKKLELSDSATISVLQQGNSWVITDLDPAVASYLVRKENNLYLLGTDQFGRDILSRVLSGARSLVLIALIGSLLGIFLGLVVGMGSGYTGGRVDEVVMRIVDGMMAFPGLLLALLILSTVGAEDPPWRWLDKYWEGLLIILTVGVVFMPGVARVMRSVTLKAKNLEFVMSARLRGETSVYIIFKEILPTALTVLAVELSVRLSYAILIVSSLGFLGLGVQPPSPDWGLMIGDSRQFIAAAPWMCLAPAGAVASLVVGVNLLTDGVRQASGLPREIPS